MTGYLVRKRWFWKAALGVLWLILLWVEAAGATSLWAQAREPVNLFADRRASREGDLLTIIIVERTQATQNASTKTGKGAEVGVGPGLGALSDLLPYLKAEGGDEYNASGTTVRGGSLSARLTVVVKEVLPNGILVVEGRQEIVVNGEKQKIVVSGLVRPEDITAENTVLSTYVADARITYQGEGPLGAKQEPGILTRIFNWLF